MLSAISWGQYAIFIVIILAVYYCFITLTYYRGELASYFRTFQIIKKLPDAEMSSAISTEAQASVLSNLVHELMDELNVVLHKATLHGYPKEELLMALQMILRNYYSLKGTQFQISIVDYIRSESIACCNIIFDDFELVQVWQ